MDLNDRLIEQIKNVFGGERVNLFTTEARF